MDVIVANITVRLRCTEKNMSILLNTDCTYGHNEKN